VTQNRRHPKRRVAVRGRLSDGKLRIARDPEAYELSAVAATIWKLSNGRRSLDDIVAAVAAEFEADRATIEADVVEFVDELVEIDFMEWTASPPETHEP
jgi:hypothetical protein